MSVTTRFGSSVKRNITQFGKTVSYKRTIDGIYDPETGVTNTSTTTSIKAFKTQVSSSDAKSPNLVGKEVSGFLVSGVDISFVPSTGDEITYTNKTETFTLRVVNVKEYWAGDEVAMYRLLCAAI